jgi:hypothetical protein
VPVSKSAHSNFSIQSFIPKRIQFVIESTSNNSADHFIFIFYINDYFYFNKCFMSVIILFIMAFINYYGFQRNSFRFVLFHKE